MVSFVRNRLQVFVSSTFTDLIQERQAAVEAILTAGHIPAGMELFTAGDESQMEVIKQWIDKSDVYLTILAGRYGSIEPNTRKSYTQLEYEYAVEKGKPLFACVITDEALEERVKAHGSSQIETDDPQKLKDFRDLVLSKTSRFWADQKDIKIEVGKALSTLARRDDLKGWVRAEDEVNASALADEIARLSKENSDLRSQIASGKSNQTFIGLDFEEIRRVLENREILKVFLALAPKFAQGLSPADYKVHGFEPKAVTEGCQQLIAIGLIYLQETSDRSPMLGHPSTRRIYRLTDPGHAFLNKLQAQGL